MLVKFHQLLDLTMFNYKFTGLRNISMYDIDESKATIDNLNLSNESVQVAALLTKWGNRAHG